MILDVLCDIVVEDISHVLRGCPAVKANWFQIIKPDKQSLRLRNETLHALTTQAVPHSLISPENVMRRWSKPPRGWIKVNTDGAHNPSTGFSCCGEVGCDENMHWCFGYSKNIGICSTFDAELWTIYEGPLAAWSLGYSRECIMVADRLDKTAIHLSLDYLYFLDPTLFGIAMLNVDALVEP
ncbi:hypothetical protein GQ457_13G019790 [Hibiscus cannabinus]